MLNSLNLGFQNPENAKKDVRTETNSDAFFLCRLTTTATLQQH